MSEKDSASPAFLREELERKVNEFEPSPRPEAVGLSEEEMGEAEQAMVLLLQYYPRDHPDLPDDPRKSELYKEIKAHAGTTALIKAIESGDWGAINFQKGVTGSGVEATGYERLINLVKPPAQQVLIRGPMGSGKSVFALDLARRAYSEGVVQKIATNIKGVEHESVRFCENISEYLEFAKEPGEKLAILDEFSTVGNAYTGQYEVENIMSRVINAFRKSEGGSLRTFFIGHQNDTDIHPLVRRQADVVIEKVGKKEHELDKAKVYTTEGENSPWESYKKGEEEFVVHGLQDIKKDSKWGFDSNYFSHIEWDLDNPEQQIQRGQIIDNWRDYQEEDDEEEQEVVRCKGTKDDGSRCKTTSVEDETVSKIGYCRHHVDQYSPDDD